MAGLAFREARLPERREYAKRAAICSLHGPGFVEQPGLVTLHVEAFVA